MLGSEDILIKYLGDSPVAFIVAGLSLLIVMNLVLSLWLANKSKTDDINFNLLPDFIQPLLLYTFFIIAMEALMIIAHGIPAIKTIFASVEVVGIATVAIKYVKQIYDKLKKLGMPADTQLDQMIENKLDHSIGEISNEPIVIPSPTEEPVQQEEVPASQYTSKDEIVPGRPEDSER